VQIPEASIGDVELLSTLASLSKNFVYVIELNGKKVNALSDEIQFMGHSLVRNLSDPNTNYTAALRVVVLHPAFSLDKVRDINLKSLFRPLYYSLEIMIFTPSCQFIPRLCGGIHKDVWQPRNG
jgi:hypothetical protein